MDSLHKAHLVMLKMFLKAKHSLYWLRINQVENYIPCQVVAGSQKYIPAIPIEVPFRPW